MNKIDPLFSNHRRRTLQAFANCIEECHRLGVNKWGITEVVPDHVRLLFGSVVVASIKHGILWLAMPPKEDSFLDNCISWQWTPVPEWIYKRPPSRSGFYLPREDFDITWPEIRQRHFAYLARCGDTYKKLRKQSRDVHSDDFLEALESELGRSLPSPKH